MLQKLRAICDKTKDVFGGCPANDRCKLYQFCSQGQHYGIINGGYGVIKERINRLNIVPWSDEQIRKLDELTEERT